MDGEVGSGDSGAGGSGDSGAGGSGGRRGRGSREQLSDGDEETMLVGLERGEVDIDGTITVTDESSSSSPENLATGANAVPLRGGVRGGLAGQVPQGAQGGVGSAATHPPRRGHLDAESVRPVVEHLGLSLGGLPRGRARGRATVVSSPRHSGIVHGVGSDGQRISADVGTRRAVYYRGRPSSELERDIRTGRVQPLDRERETMEIVEGNEELEGSSRWEMAREVVQRVTETQAARTRSRSRSALRVALNSPPGRREDLLRQLRFDPGDSAAPVLSSRPSAARRTMGSIARSLDDEVEAACTGVYNGAQMLAEFHKLRILSEIFCKMPWCRHVEPTGCREVWTNNWIAPGSVVALFVIHCLIILLFC